MMSFYLSTIFLIKKLLQQQCVLTFVQNTLSFFYSGLFLITKQINYFLVNIFLLFSNIIDRLKSILEIFTTNIDPFLQRLDPALFQNIILGVLAIFIPFGIVFLTDVLDSKKEKRSEFEEMVFNDEVLGTKKVFWLSILGIVFFAFFSGVDTPIFAKRVTIIVAMFLILLFWKPFKKILKFSEGYKSEFEISFLEKLGFSKIFKFRNQEKTKKMVRAWNSFWSEESKFNESDFTKIFISHIDDVIKFKKFNLAVQLGKIYTNNIEKRDQSLINNEILQKVFKWNEIFWDQEQSLYKSLNNHRKVIRLLSEKNFNFLCVFF